MNLADPTARINTGLAMQEKLLGIPAPEAATLFESSWPVYVFSEVWTRPGLDLRSRFWIAISSAACAGGDPAALLGYLRGALTLGEVTLAELREAALHVAVYAGWSSGGVLDQAVTRIAVELNLPPAETAPIRAEPWDPKTRLAQGAAGFHAVMTFPGPPPICAYFETGILNFVFGEMWMRPGLDQRARRWLTLVCVANSSSDTPIRSHVYAAIASGNASMDEMGEFILQYAIHGGWPRASVLQTATFDMGKRVAEGLPFQ